MTAGHSVTIHRGEPPATAADQQHHTTRRSKNQSRTPRAARCPRLHTSARTGDRTAHTACTACSCTHIHSPSAAQKISIKENKLVLPSAQERPPNLRAHVQEEYP
eukprot:3842146-Prymnesium_polylepis.2